VSGVDVQVEQASSDKSENELLTDLASLVVGMSRLLTSLAAMGPFRNAEFSMADWVALSLLAKGPPNNNRQLAKSLGVTRQRANQIKTSLEQARLISVSQSTEDARQIVLTVSNRGQGQLDSINMQLAEALASSLKNKQRVLLRANRAIKLLMRTLRTGNESTKKSGRERTKGTRRKLMRTPRADT